MALCTSVEARRMVTALKDLKVAASGIRKETFVFSRVSGICWHMTVNVDMYRNVLPEVFKELGYDENYPIEMQVVDNDNHACQMYSNDRIKKYSKNSETGKLRLEMIDRLIAYFEKKM